MDQNTILETLDRGLPVMEIVPVSGQQATEGLHVRGFPRQEGSALRVEPPERVIKYFVGEWTIAVRVSATGCVGANGAAADSGLLGLTRGVPGAALATNTRLVGSAQGDVLHRPVGGAEELLWELDYAHVTDIHIVRKRSTFTMKETGLMFSAKHGTAEGVVAVNRIDEVDQRTHVGRRPRDLTSFATEIARSIFEERAAKSTDSAYLDRLATARGEGWRLDPDNHEDLAVSIPVEDPATPGSSREASQQTASSTVADTTTVPQGWYPDPVGRARLRWWDGSEWTGHTSV